MEFCGSVEPPEAKAEVDVGAGPPCGEAAEYHARLPKISDENRKCLIMVAICSGFCPVDRQGIELLKNKSRQFQISMLSYSSSRKGEALIPKIRRATLYRIMIVKNQSEEGDGRDKSQEVRAFK